MSPGPPNVGPVTESRSERTPPAGGGAGRAGPVDRWSDAAHFGRFGEAAAARWYRRAGYRILARNWRCRQGELDLVVLREGEVTFVEVKARTSDRFGRGAEAVDHRKRQRIRATAARWLEQAEWFAAEIRFDVVEVDRRGHLDLHHDCF